MLYKGFCDKQGKQYVVEITQISMSALEDKTPSFGNGRLNCEYASHTGCCGSIKDCSILKQQNS